MDIRKVNNGYIIETNGNVFIAKTLTEAATIMGEYTPPVPSYIQYKPGYDASVYQTAKNLVKQGRKIEAIKTVRAAFTPTLALREAKELVDALAGTTSYDDNNFFDLPEVG